MVPRRRNHRRHLHVFTLGRIVLFFVLRVGMERFLSSRAASKSASLARFRLRLHGNGAGEVDI